MGTVRMVTTLLIITLMFAMQVLVYAANVKSKSPLENQKYINPHWESDRCKSCHIGEPGIGKYDLIGDSEVLCMDCHSEDTKHIYIHPVKVDLPINRRTAITINWNGNLRLDDNGKISCQTCHDLLNQCLKNRAYQHNLNPRFLRGGPYQNRYAICYRCHDAEKYEQTNSHDQIDTKTGLMKIDKCRLCHEVDIQKSVKAGIQRDLKQYPIIKGLNEDRTLLCIRCHRKIDHPSQGFTVRSNKKYRHFIPMSQEKWNTLKKQSNETGVYLPLEPVTERIYCGTCHQPHQSGVFSGEEIGTPTRSNHRLRASSICKYCHDIYGSMESLRGN